MVPSLNCKHCEHQCHCSNNGECSIESCNCKNCEHNALDEFHKNLQDGFKESVE